MRRQNEMARQGLAAALLAGLLGSGLAQAQPMDLDTPASSPLWWTVSEEISPVELRKALRDPNAHLQRYRDALAAGVAAQELNEEALSYLSFYYNRRLTPELTPLWLAFDAFAGGHLELLGSPHATETLAEFGLGNSAIDTILLYASRQLSETQMAAEEVAEKSLKFVEIQRHAISDLGGDRAANALVRRAVKQGDLDLLLPGAEVSRAELAELRAAWLRQPVTEVAEKLLPELRQQLIEEDWQRLRRFLLEHVVTGMGTDSIDFDEGKGGSQ